MHTDQKLKIFTTLYIIMYIFVVLPDLFLITSILGTISFFSLYAYPREEYPAPDFIGSNFYVPDLPKLIAEIDAERSEESTNNEIHHNTTR